MTQVISNLGLKSEKWLGGKLYTFNDREVVYCPEDHRRGRAYSMQINGLINFSEEFTTTNKLKDFLTKRIRYIKNEIEENRLKDMEEDFND